jgi:hypothetical protein
MAAGIYKKPIEAIAKEIHYERLPGEVRTVIISRWMRGGLLPQQVIEQIAPVLPTQATTDGATT